MRARPSPWKRSGPAMKAGSASKREVVRSLPGPRPLTSDRRENSKTLPVSSSSSVPTSTRAPGL
ncbi:hypothetical protein [Myxococcus llanfairpwllgwyngyllgogerychwyrndrobwllllantysiliogogogochensis]|uniref:hypothetical protein n=1 Tax=Myxococcus llanfairpwllgwyngyllgogerychwyrndrobwllllantysiliogogogochensis TaxID=2590453 RepID=UPI00114796DF|nr:hypothetical protein [Myxococcus llanfairpwllgwyngyllgogerychwyrndrobwllllantysiliogogogochensis]